MFRICNQTNVRGAENHTRGAGTSSCTYPNYFHTKFVHYMEESWEGQACCSPDDGAQAVISQHILQEKMRFSHMELKTNISDLLM